MTGDSRRGDRVARLTIPEDATILDALRAIDAGAEAIIFVRDKAGRVVGALTDGDVRRAILGGAMLESRSIPQAMRRDFISVTAEAGRAEVLDVMRARQIEQIPVLDADGRLRGLHTMRELISAAQRPNRALILAGGMGTRLYPITATLPKPMVSVAGRPILERLVLHLMSCGLRRFTLSVNYLAHVIEEHFGDGSRFGCEIEYLRESEPLGTGGPIAVLDPPPALPLLVLNGDLVTQCDLGRMLDFHERGGYAATLGVRAYSVEIPFGVAEVEGNCLIGLREKPTERMLINAGIYVFSPETVGLAPRGAFPITQLFEHCLARGSSVGAHFLEEEWLDIGRPEELRRARGEDDAGD
jgi:dTDP-glucose pyrophosphorylase/CBS domain-containing protein